jgi:hypothetical protein
MNYRIEGKSIILPGGDVAQFDYPISETIDFEDVGVIAVRLKIPPRGQFNENVFGLAYDASVRWQIPLVRHVRADSPYIAMRRQGSQLEADNWDGLGLILDPKTGRILEETYKK